MAEGSHLQLTLRSQGTPKDSARFAKWCDSIPGVPAVLCPACAGSSFATPRLIEEGAWASVRHACDPPAARSVHASCLELDGVPNGKYQLFRLAVSEWPSECFSTWRACWHSKGSRTDATLGTPQIKNRRVIVVSFRLEGVVHFLL